jgi:hypothetical protein
MRRRRRPRSLRCCLLAPLLLLALVCGDEAGGVLQPRAALPLVGAAAVPRTERAAATSASSLLPLSCSVQLFLPGAALPSRQRLTVSIHSAGASNGDGARTFLLTLPDGYADAPRRSVPALLAVAGALQQADTFLDAALKGPAAPIDAKAAAAGYAIVAPNSLCEPMAPDGRGGAASRRGANATTTSDAASALTLCRWAQTMVRARALCCDGAVGKLHALTCCRAHDDADGARSGVPGRRRAAAVR